MLRSRETKPTAIVAAAQALDALDPLELQVLLASRKPARQKRAKPALETVQYLNADELVALFAVITDPRDRAIFELAYHRGARVSEIGLLTLANLRLAAKRLYVGRLKNGTPAEFVITDREVKALKAWLRVRGLEPGPLFLSRNHKPISSRRLDELMKRYGAAAGLPPEKRHFHCLRHSCGTSLRTMGVAIEDIQDHLGHRDIRNTMIYAKLTSPKRTELGERLQREW